MFQFRFSRLSLVIAALLCGFQSLASAEQIPLTGCVQSTTDGNSDCDKAIDGNTRQNYGGPLNSCTHTTHGNAVKDWWRARTHQLTHFKQVRIFNRLDCCSVRLNDFSILVDGQVCASYRASQPFGERTFDCDRIGQVIQINTHLSEPLTLCEVQVFGEIVSPKNPGYPLKLTGCLQSSTIHDGSCTRAIDGNTNQNYGGLSCIHTSAEKGWWQATTSALSRITHIRIYNRLDCCSESLSDFVVTIDGHECASYRSNGFFSVETFDCNREGQVVRISNKLSSPLMMCEVQVFGEEIAIDPTPSGKQLKLTECAQSSVSSDGQCNRAIDGNTNQHYGENSCTFTSPEQGWWQAQTHKISNITHIRIYNRLDCCSERLNDFSITVNGHECASYHSDGFFSVKTFECFAIGQLIRIKNRKPSTLSLCEVQVFGTEVSYANLGEHLTLTDCAQSSVAHDGACHRAMDGNLNQNYDGASCIHTEVERGWWQARTDKLATVSHVRIFNRLDCCSDSLTDFAVSVDGHECFSYRSTRFFSVETFVCSHVGQVIRITNRRPTPLMLCEVQVFGTPVTMAPPAKQIRLSKCSQSSTTHEGICDRAIDGIRLQNYGDNSCIHTGIEKGWWQAQTAKPAFITHVRIYNRLDCCSDWLNDISILVGEHECASYQSDGFFSVMTFECNAVGQVIRIENNKMSPLTLCEVQVFGSDPPK